jgi:hypothetical protein
MTMVGLNSIIMGYNLRRWDVIQIVCGLIFFLAIAISGQQAKEEGKKESTLPVQRTPRRVVRHASEQSSIERGPSAPDAVAKPALLAVEKYPDTQEGWANKGRNLELARDWDGAANAYQKAGLYVEAGRVRQSHMEKEEAQVKINIDRIGHNIQDSVVMGDSDADTDSK